jgi:hypothetical protein
MALSLVQTIANSVSAATSLTVTPGATTGANHLLVLSIVDADVTTAPTITDTAGNTWVKAVSSDYTYPRQGLIYYCQNAAAITSVTITPSASQYIYAQFYEVSGIATSGALDVTISASGSSTAPTATTAATSVASEFAVGFIGDNASGGTISGVTSGWTAQTQIHPNSGAGMFPAYQILSATGTVTLAGTLNVSLQWGVYVATFKAAAAAAVVVPPPLVINQAALIRASIW